MPNFKQMSCKPRFIPPVCEYKAGGGRGEDQRLPGTRVLSWNYVI